MFSDERRLREEANTDLSNTVESLKKLQIDFDVSCLLYVEFVGDRDERLLQLRVVPHISSD